MGRTICALVALLAMTGTISAARDIDYRLGDSSFNSSSGHARKLMAAAPMKIFAVYTTDWAQYRQYVDDPKYPRPDWCKPYGYTPKNLKGSMYTHINYAFAKVIDGTFEVVGSEHNDDELIKELMAVKGPDTKVLISIGGWSFSRAWGVFEGTGSDKIFPKLAAKKSRRRRFIKSAIKYAKDRGFDGIDLDWEYPNWDDYDAPKERTDFTKLIRHMRKATKREGLLLTAAMRAAKPNRHYQLKKVAESLDFINLMTYDYYGGSFGSGPFLAKTHTPVKDCNGRWCGQAFDIDIALEQYSSAGVPSSKIVLGVANYGRTFKLDSPSNGATPPAHGIAKASGPAPKGDCTWEPGVLATYEIERVLQESGSEVSVDKDQTLSAWATYGDNKENWVGFDTKETHKLKLCYARSRDLGGVFAWDAELDDNADLLNSLRSNFDNLDCAGYQAPKCGPKPSQLTCISGPPPPSSNNDNGADDKPAQPKPPTLTGKCPYTIKGGDTFWGISQELKTTVDAIMALNPGVDAKSLQVGQQIMVPCAEGEGSNGGDGGSCSYTIKSGDTFWKIAEAHGTTVEAIQALNEGVAPEKLWVGQQVKVPC